jgi:hypothetical protein
MIALLAGILMTGCTKDIVTPDATSLTDLKVTDSFNWSTGMPVELRITGLPTIVPVQSTLTIALSDGSSLFNQLHNMDQNLTVQLVIPDDQKELTLQYGSATYQVAIVNNVGEFSFIPVLIN